jgi:hemoglobin
VDRAKYTGRNMTETHHNMGVTNGEFDAFMEDLVAVLDDFKVGKAEQDEILNMLRPMRGEIVEVDSKPDRNPAALHVRTGTASAS